MGATDSVMGAPEGLLSVFLITGFLLGTCLNGETCVGDACFNEGVLQLKIDRARTDTVSGLRYKERSKDLVAMVDVIGVCLPGVNPNALADSFSSCKNEKMEEVCTLAKRGWLENKEGKSVVNENGLIATFGDIKGGEDAVRSAFRSPRCMNTSTTNTTMPTITKSTIIWRSPGEGKEELRPAMEIKKPRKREKKPRKLEKKLGRKKGRRGSK